jgi:hypothetical protein
VGDEYPGAEILGVDLSPIQPAWVPPNVRFLVDDIEANWVYPKDYFDLVHARHMTSSLKNWPQLLDQAYTYAGIDVPLLLLMKAADLNTYSHIKPGGWVELQELRFTLQCDDNTMRPNYAVESWFLSIKEGLAALGVNLLAMEDNQARARSAGFVNVVEKVFKVPLGVWPRDKNMKMVGLYNRSCIWDGLQGISMGPLTRGLHWSPQEVEVFLVGVRKALMDASYHVYLPFHVVYGQKPMKVEI